MLLQVFVYVGFGVGLWPDLGPWLGRGVVPFLLLSLFERLCLAHLWGMWCVHGGFLCLVPSGIFGLGVAGGLSGLSDGVLVDFERVYIV
jgi:hypothetical protein